MCAAADDELIVVDVEPECTPSPRSGFVEAKGDACAARHAFIAETPSPVVAVVAPGGGAKRRRQSCVRVGIPDMLHHRHFVGGGI